MKKTFCKPVFENEKICCFTGYRPSKFPFAFKRENEQYIRMENDLIETVFSMPQEECYTFLSGMAMGFDIIAAETVLLLKRTNPYIRLICVLPFASQSDTFSDLWKRRFNNVINNADDVIILSEKFFPSCYFRRNDYMVDNSDFVITWFDGKKGGTAETLRYAKKRGRCIINLNDGFRVVS